MANEQDVPTLCGLDLPPVPVDRAPLPPLAQERVLAILQEGARHLKESAQGGSGAAGTALALVGESLDRDLAALAERLAGAGGSPGEGARTGDLASLSGALRHAAASALSAGQAGLAAAALALLVETPGGTADDIVGLAVCAGRLGRAQAAVALALAALDRQPGHPRACLVAGLGYLDQGERRSAQAYLAAASRSARKRPEYRDDLRAAQRALLLLHLA